MKNYYSLKTPKSTQILDKNIKVDKTIRPHIPIETQISNVFEIETEKIHAYTSERNVDEQFWKNIAREEYGCGGPPELNGWITKFFPYDCEGNLVDNWLDESTLPDGRITIKFNIEKKGEEEEEEEEEELIFVTGFLGVRQQIIENSDGEVIVKPVIGWAIIDDIDEDFENNLIMHDNISKKTKLFWC
ncbi:unnamed protein product [Rhizophagus irregularis]|uniref:Uncharacterized protein n=1 Tax=Rhizophagus irregularis TaxID=588596 RepID=A0A916EL99_9GLOM|nr:unnamed protein product [Rhizophagus irregularis]